MYRIISNRGLALNVNEIVIEHADMASKCKPGQFAIVMSDEFAERIPLTVSDWDREKGLVTICFVQAGTSTRKLALKKEGDMLKAFVGPLGKPSQVLGLGSGKILCVGGCYGIGAIYPIARALRESGCRVILTVEARSRYMLYWREKLERVSDRMYTITRDGSDGHKGHVTEGIDIALKGEGAIDRIIVIGCTFMMMLASEHTKPLGIRTFVSLNPIMVDGTGMCGVCRVEVGGKTRFACVDGPEFDGHQVDWGMLLLRRKAYMREEIHSFSMFECIRDM
jgi:ferredoxin--NADP+ reductase